MVKFNFGLGGNKNDDDGQTTDPVVADPAPVADPQSDQGQAFVADDEVTPLEVAVPQAQEVELEPAIEESTPEPTFDANANPFTDTAQVPATEEADPIANPFATTSEAPVGPLATEPSLQIPTMDANPFANNVPVPSEQTFVEATPEAPVSNDANPFADMATVPTADETVPEATLSIDPSANPFASTAEAPVEQPVAEVAPAAPVANDANPFADSASEPAAAAAVEENDDDFSPFGGGDQPAPVANTTGSGDPTKTLAVLTNEIQSFIEEHENNIKNHEEEIKKHKDAIKDEKQLIEDKKAEFSGMIQKLEDLVGHFGKGGSSSKSDDDSDDKKKGSK